MRYTKIFMIEKFLINDLGRNSKLKKVQVYSID